MTPIALFLALAAVPDAGPALAWKVTYTTSFGADVGNGKIAASGETTTVVTPVDVRMAAEGVTQGQATGSVLEPRPIDPKVRDAIAALLPKLPKSAAFSTSPYVDDEGWNSANLAIELNGKTVRFQLQQGKRVPPLPPVLNELLKLVGLALKKP